MSGSNKALTRDLVAAWRATPCHLRQQVTAVLEREKHAATPAAAHDAAAAQLRDAFSVASYILVLLIDDTGDE